MIGVKRTRLRKEKAVALCARTTRFIAGLCIEMGLNDDKELAFSLHFIVLEQYMRPLVEVLTSRAAAQRRYQVEF